MSDNRDFDFSKIPAVQSILASGVPESMDLSSKLEEAEAEGEQLKMWQQIAAERSVEIIRLRQERDELREQVKRLLG